TRHSADQPPAVVTEAWRAQHRLHRRYRHLVGHGKRPTVAVAALARELAGFVWAAMTRTATDVVASKPLEAIRAYQSHSSSQPPARSAPSPLRNHARATASLT